MPIVSSSPVMTLPEAEHAAEILGANERALRAFLRARLGAGEGVDGEVDDVLQDLWLRVRRAIGDVREPEAIRTWLYRTAVRLAIDHLRSAARRRRREEVVAARRAVSEGTSGAELEPDVAAVLAEECESLPEPYRTVLGLRYRRGLSLDELAAETGVGRSTVKSHLARGLARLRGKPRLRRLYFGE